MATYRAHRASADRKANSGASKSSSNPFGVRRKRSGRDLAPKSLRKKGKVYLEDCSHEELEKAGVM